MHAVPHGSREKPSRLKRTRCVGVNRQQAIAKASTTMRHSSSKQRHEQQKNNRWRPKRAAKWATRDTRNQLTNEQLAGKGRKRYLGMHELVNKHRVPLLLSFREIGRRLLRHFVHLMVVIAIRVVVRGRGGSERPAEKALIPVPSTTRKPGAHRDVQTSERPTRCSGGDVRK